MLIRITAPIKLGQRERCFNPSRTCASHILFENVYGSNTSVSSRGFDSCWRCLMCGHCLPMSDIGRRNSSIETHISPMVLTSLLQLISSSVGDETLLLTVAAKIQVQEWWTITFMVIVMKKKWPIFVLSGSMMDATVLVKKNRYAYYSYKGRGTQRS